ncbi:MAG TPA: hypothetical protein VMA36_05850 [Candidatus Limnocylindria bacterium]|nr:hypothetical protein [Candidatus Limnocylindria bacterium]
MHVPHDGAGIAAGVRAALWILGLWYAAPLVARRAAWAERIVATAALGIAIPCALGIAGVLAAPTAWALLVALVVARVVRAGWREASFAPTLAGCAGVVVLVALAWPPAVRPVMDGDTLQYHLPNAAAWVSHHSLWTTGTTYWWYPPAAELFAAGLWAVAGAPSVGLTGIVPAALLLARFMQVARERGRSPWIGAALAALLLATPAARAEIVSVQNDLWLAAFFVEAFVTQRALARSICALIKPHAVAFAFLSIARERWRRPSTFVFLVPFALWVLRDALLVHGAVFSPASASVPEVWKTTIAWNLPGSAAVLAGALLHAGIATTALALTGILAGVFDARYRLAALGALAIFLVIPFGYVNPLPQLADGQSLRYALPLFALGALRAVTLPRYVAAAAAALSVAAVAFEVDRWWDVFANDATTHDVPYVVAVAAVALAVLVGASRRGLRVGVYGTLGLLAAVAWAAGLAATHPLDYLTDRFDPHRGSAGVFVRLHALAPRRLVVAGLPAGAFVLAVPSARVDDAVLEGCDQARAAGALLVTTAMDGCTGTLLYRDTAIRVVAPSGERFPGVRS